MQRVAVKTKVVGADVNQNDAVQYSVAIVAVPDQVVIFVGSMCSDSAEKATSTGRERHNYATDRWRISYARIHIFSVIQSIYRPLHHDQELKWSSSSLEEKISMNGMGWMRQGKVSSPRVSLLPVMGMLHTRDQPGWSRRIMVDLFVAKLNGKEGAVNSSNLST